MSKKVKLKDALKNAELFIDGDWIESKDQDQNGDIRLIQLADIGNGKYLNKSSRFMTLEKAEKLKCTFIKKGDILLARMPEPLGRSCLFLGDEKLCVTVVDICIIRPDKTINSSYLNHQINSSFVRNQINNYITGTTRKRISRSNLGKVEILLPSLEKQKQIAKTLDKANELIELRKESITKLDALAKSIFIDMFGDPVSNPKGWETKKLKEIIILQRGHDLPTNQRDLDGEIDLYGASGLSGKHNIAKVFGGGIITGRSGTIGQVNYTKKDFWPLNTTLFSKETFNNNLIFLCYLLRFLKLENYANYTSVPTLNRNIIHEIEVYDISIDLQNKFAEIIEKIEEQKSLYEKELELLQINFDALLQKSFQE